MKHQRTRLGIRSAEGVRSPWKKWELELLRKETDTYVARVTGRTPLAVRVMRRKLGLFHRPVRRWTAAELKLLGTDTDAKIAKLLGRTRKSVSHMRERIA